VEDNQNLSQDRDPQLIEALQRLGRNEIRSIDEVTRRRHLAQLKSRKISIHRTRLVGTAAALVLLLGGILITRIEPTNELANVRSSANEELAPLNPVEEITSVPFNRTEEYTIVKVSARRAAEISEIITTSLGESPVVIGKNTASTTFVVPASFAASLPDSDAITKTIDSPIKATAEQTPVPSWGLDRVDSTDGLLNNSYQYVSTGSSSYVYVIDTGIYSGHSDLAGRVTAGYSAISDGTGSEDCNGHGTHVAGTIAGSAYGVAKSTRLVAVRVLDCAGSGYSSSVVAGINWVVQSHPGGTGIINMSLGGPSNSAIDSAVADATNAGLTVVVAAGNSSTDACNSSPARAPSAITIGAIDRTDSQASYSNYGSCVDLWAPGTSITSSWIGGATASRTISGTSMAAPHVAGLAARLAQSSPGISNAEIVAKLSTPNSKSLAVTTFVETEDPTSTTSTLPGTTTTVTPETSIPVVTTTTVPSPTTTIRPGGGKKDKAVRPRNFALNFRSQSGTNVLVASWLDVESSESFKLSCVLKQSSDNDSGKSEDALEAETLNVPVDKMISFDRSKVTSLTNGRSEIALTSPLTAYSRCWLVAIVGARTSERSNIAVAPKDKKAPETTTTSTSVVPTTTVSPTTTVAASRNQSPPPTAKPSTPSKAPNTTKPPTSQRRG